MRRSAWRRAGGGGGRSGGGTHGLGEMKAGPQAREDRARKTGWLGVRRRRGVHFLEIARNETVGWGVGWVVRFP